MEWHYVEVVIEENIEGVIKIPNGGYKYLVENINRKLSLAKIASSHKGKEIIDDVIDNDLPKLVEVLRNRRK
ncbi:hypothetical protein LCGC14_2462450 [marine sediment metagenome]|uniref:Uncharacterized protein n=1 Tax=marine sediment metagenome TaxID=412755 RepID=A0A0F9DQ04_9ZZZZ